MYRTILDTELKIDTTLGYQYFIDKNHPLAKGNASKVLLHRHVASISIGRWLNSSEIVHHIDGNKLNNDISNLLVVSSKEHGEIHLHRSPSTCHYCGNVFLPKVSKAKYCSETCKLSNRKSSLDTLYTPEQLEIILWSKGFRGGGKLLGISDNGFKKLCTRLKVLFPPPYFTNKYPNENKRLEEYKLAKALASGGMVDPPDC